MKHTKKLAALLAVLLVISAILCSCGEGTEDPKETNSDTIGAETTPETDGRLQSSLPAGLKFNGEEINVWYFTKGDDPSSEAFVDLKGDVQGDNVESAIYARNIEVEEQLGITLNYVDAGVTSGGVGTAVRTQVMSDSSDYDLYNVIQWNSAILAAENLFLDISGEDYLDLEKPWWSQSYMSALSASESMYFLAGDISLDMIRCNAAMYYNKDIFAELYKNSDALYQTVLDGDWTLDYLMTCVEDAFVDMNDNSRTDAGDRFGLMANNYNNVDAFTFGAGTLITERDDLGYPTLIAPREHNVNVYDKTYRLYYETPGTYVEDPKVTTPEFIAGNSLFFSGFLYTSEFLRDMKNYGIVPMPKYDANQIEYVSVVHNIATLMCLPTTCEKVEAVTAMLEAMAYVNYYEVTPVYYESALKTKYIRDSNSARMIDIIHDSSMTDFAYVYEGSLGNIGLIMRLLISERGTNYTSRCTGLMRSAERYLEDFITGFEES